MLDDIRVIDLSRLLPGPMASWYLRGMGAEVIKIEDAEHGDGLRHVPPYRSDGSSAWFAALNAGKRSVALDLKRPEEQARLRRLLDSADVLIEGFRPGVMARLGLDPEALRRSHPGIIIASITGYGQQGPMANQPGHDLGYAGLAGALSLATRRDGAPDVPALPMADLAGGALSAAMSICAALYARERSGEGRWLDINMTEGLLALMSPYIASTAAGSTPAPGGELLTGGWARYGLYRCRDERLIAIAAVEPKFWAELADRIGFEPEATTEALTELFASQDRDHWVDRLGAACVTPVLEVEELLHSPLHARSLRGEGENRRVAPAFFSDPEAVTAPAPALGEGNDELLESL